MKRGRGLYIDIRKTRVKHFVTKGRRIETSLLPGSLLCLLLHLPAQENIYLNEQGKNFYVHIALRAIARDIHSKYVFNGRISSCLNSQVVSLSL